MTQATDTEIRDLILGLDKKIETKLDAIAADVMEVKIAQARTDERFNSIDQRFNSIDQRLDSLEERFKSQDNRIWSLIAGVVLALFGLLVKMAFFPTGQI